MAFNLLFGIFLVQRELNVLFSRWDVDYFPNREILTLSLHKLFFLWVNRSLNPYISISYMRRNIIVRDTLPPLQKYMSYNVIVEKKKHDLIQCVFLFGGITWNMFHFHSSSILFTGIDYLTAPYKQSCIYAIVN